MSQLRLSTTFGELLGSVRFYYKIVKFSDTSLSTFNNVEEPRGNLASYSQDSDDIGKLCIIV